MTTEQLRGLLIALAEENAQLDAALDSMLDGIVVCNLAHHPIIFNKSAERILRFSVSDPTDRELWLGISDRELAAFFRESLTSEDTVLGREFGIDSGSGTTRVIAASITPLISSKKTIVGTLIHLDDITEKRRREGQLRRAESLASLTTLAAGVAHEIKNPLGSISIHIQLVKRALKLGGMPDMASVDRHLGVVDEEIERLNKIVVDFLFAVRPMDIQLILSDPRDTVREVAELMRYEAERNDVELIVDLPDKISLILLDKRYLKQAILNLVSNALAAMPEGGKLLLGIASDDAEVRIRIEDTGVGIPEDKLSKIFEPYYSTKENGTGLGLTITFKIVKEHSGEIAVSSKPSQGTVFTIILPVPQKDRKLLGHTDPGSVAARN
jgi:PAS domain S-box-containing protein